MFGFLKSIVGGGQDAPRHWFAAPDPSFGYSEVSRIAGLLKQGNYSAVKDFYYSISSDKRSALVDGIALTDQHAKVLAQWTAKDPHNPAACCTCSCPWPT